MTRKALLLISFALLLTAESAWFARQSAAGVMGLMARRAFRLQDYATSLRRYRTALRWGVDENALETGMAEMLLFVVGQSDAGAVKIDLPLPRPEAARAAHATVDRLVERLPYSAYHWMLASQSYLNEARRRRRETSIRIGSLSADPLENLLPEDRLGLAALEVASRLEPNNATYHDALVELYLSAGSPQAAAGPCRSAVASYPIVQGHGFLSRSDLPEALVEAAVLGFEDAAGSSSMIPRAVIETEAGTFLSDRGDNARAAGILARAAASEPAMFDARYRLGYVLYRLSDYQGALEHLGQATAILPDQASPYYYIGLTRLAMEDVEGAIEAFTSARERRPDGLQFFRMLGETLERAGRHQEAERQFLAATNLHPGRGETWIDLLGFYLRRRDARAAHDVCARFRAQQVESEAVIRQCADLERGAQ